MNNNQNSALLNQPDMFSETVGSADGLGQLNRDAHTESTLHSRSHACVSKQQHIADFLDALRQIIGAYFPMREAISDKKTPVDFYEDHGLQTLPRKLSDREREVFNRIGQGQGTRQIAENLGLSIKTIETHRANIKEKLCIKTAPELVCAAATWVSAH